MPTYDITGPDGVEYEVDAPDDAAVEHAVRQMFGGASAPAAQPQQPQQPPVGATMGQQQVPTVGNESGYPELGPPDPNLPKSYKATPGLHSTPEDQRGYAPLEASLQGAARVPADIAGLPVDTGAFLLNTVGGLGNLSTSVSNTVRGRNDALPWQPITEPVGGSDWFAKQASKASAAVGAEPMDYDAMNPKSKLAYQGTRFGLGGLVQGLGLRGVAAGREGAEAPGRFHDVVKPYMGEQAGKTVMRDAAAGGGVGTGLAAADTMLPEDYRGPVTSLIAGAAGGVGGATAFDATAHGPRAGFNWLTRGKNDRNVSFNPDGSTVSKGTASDASRYMIGEAGGVKPAQEAIKNIELEEAWAAANGAPMPQTGQASKNIGLARVERGVRNSSDPSANPTLERDREINTYASNQIQGMGPAGANKDLYPQVAEQQANQMLDERNRRIGTVQGRQGTIDTAREADAGAVTQFEGQGPAASRNIDEMVRDTRVTERNRSNALYEDPELTGATVSERPLAQVADELHSLHTERAPLDPVVNKYVQRFRTRDAPAEGQPPLEDQPPLTMREVNANRAEIEKDIQDNLANGAVVQQLRQLKQTMSGYTRQLADEGLDVARAAEDNYATRVRPNFRQGAGGEFDERMKNPRASSRVVPGETADMFLTRGEDVADLNRIARLGGHEAGTSANAQAWLMDKLSRTGVVKDGVIDPEKLTRWRNRNLDVIQNVPGFEDHINGLLTRAQRGERLSTQAGGQLADAETKLASTKQEIAGGALGAVQGATGAKGIQAILSSKNAPKQMEELMSRMEGVPGGKDSVRKALSDELYARMTNSNTQLTTDNSRPPSFHKMTSLEMPNKDMDRVLAAAWADDPEALQAMHRARRVLEPRQFLETAKGTAGSATAANMDKMMRTLELGLRTLYGGFKGGNISRNIKVGLGDVIQGRDGAVQQLVARAQTDPKLAKYLLSKQLIEDPGKWASGMRKILNREEAIRQVNEKDEVELDTINVSPRQR
jgi:hypothetical protein